MVNMTTESSPALTSPATAAFNRKDESWSLTEVTARLEKSTSVCPWAAGREKSLDVWVGKTHTHIHTIQCCERCLSVALIALSPVTLWQLPTLSRISLKHFWNKVFISQYLTPRLYNNSRSSALKHVRFKAASIFLWTSLKSLHFLPGSWEYNAEIWEIMRTIFAAVLEWAIGAYTGNHPDIIINPIIITKIAPYIQSVISKLNLDSNNTFYNTINKCKKKNLLHVDSLAYKLI